MNKIIKFDDLSKIRKQFSDKRIVHCHGVFDLLHFGHVLHLQSAKKFGDILVVTVTPDRFVNKGPGRPRFSEQQRTVMLAALEVVDYVAINKHPKAIEPISVLRPDFYVKGPDYREMQKDITGGIFEEEDAVRSAGGKLVFTEDETDSSTELINQYFSQWDDNQQKTIDKIKASASLDEIMQLIESFSNMTVLIIGEPIVDTYVFCQAENLSSKSPTVSARFLYEENYAGGSLAIANHLCALGCNVSLLITHGGEQYFKELLANSLNSNIKLEEYITQGIPTPRKTRFSSSFKAQRIFELIDLRADQWLHIDPAPFCNKISNILPSHDLVIVADFGHGMFEREVLHSLNDIQTYIALNVQTNSGNYGFNPFTKHKKYNYISIDERECRLAMHDRFTSIEELARKAVSKKIHTAASITLGAEGSMYFDPNGNEHLCPSFFKEVVDTTGAGDAYFAITSLLTKLNAPGALIPFFGNCYAGLKTRILGNKSAVSKVDLVRTIQSIIK